MYQLRRSAGVLRLEKISKPPLIAKCKQLKWYGNVLRMEECLWPKKIYQWTPHGKRRRERPQQSWKNQVMDFMRSRNFEEIMAEEFGVWEQKDGLYINNNNNNNKNILQ